MPGVPVTSTLGAARVMLPGACLCVCEPCNYQLLASHTTLLQGRAAGNRVGGARGGAGGGWRRPPGACPHGGTRQTHLHGFFHATNDLWAAAGGPARRRRSAALHAHLPGCLKPCNCMVGLSELWQRAPPPGEDLQCRARVSSRSALCCLPGAVQWIWSALAMHAGAEGPPGCPCMSRRRWRQPG